MYTHSFGHYWTQQEAMKAKSIFQKEYNIHLQVIDDSRSSNIHKKWCVCEFYPEKGKDSKPHKKQGKKRAIRKSQI